jgi:hypothetical protein
MKVRSKSPGTVMLLNSNKNRLIRKSMFGTPLAMANNLNEL